ncbi:MAG: glycerol acyltransferase [Arenimonas sp. SCN 70-307]|uniref:MFS transporter n=1 Tax=Arenimonas sp. SCN 70-307 TaxID=1660089 RepID=UPI00086E1B62|nr:MFS transporter [Arenimonas sp. SCN 70-307]ODS63696.1 MAG: glycerol acyltransferase [Arenimonas sp. SCN 70-307]
MAHNQFELLGQRRFLPFFLVQSLGAFNDNVYRQAIIALLFFLGVSVQERTLYTNLAPALFILPYFLFSGIAGQIAEKLEKQRLIRITTAMEIGIMSVAAIGFLTSNMPLLLVALFGTGLQSTLFGPVKYSILPSVLKPEELTGGNGLVEMGTSMSILLGMIAGGLIFVVAGEAGPEAAAAAIVGLAITGNVISRFVPRVEASAPGLKINWNPFPESLKALRLARKQPAVRNAILGISWFWFVGTVLTAQLPAYAELFLGGGSTLYLFCFVLFSVGTGVGSLLCEKLSRRTIEIGLVPLGAIGMTVFCADLYFAQPGPSLASGLTVREFVAAGHWRIIADLTLIGLFAGLFIVPLFALVQSRTPREELSRVIAGVNIQNAFFIVVAAMLGVLLQRDSLALGGITVPLPGLSIPELFLALAIANAAVSILIFTMVPEFFLRFLAWIYVSLFYRVRITGVEDNVPDEGPALLVCNHVSYMDPLVISAAVPRPIRFVMYYKIFRIPGMNWVFRAHRAIPIAGAKEDPAVLEAAFAEVQAALQAGELVCIFPEGALTKDGEIAPFKGGVERILAANPVPVVPMALTGLWDSMWSKRDTRLGRLRVPRRLRAAVGLVADPPVPGETASAASLEARVRELRGELR